MTKPDDGKTIRITGNTMVDGVSCPVVLLVNTVDLIHVLGAKAAGSKAGRSVALNGKVTVTVGKQARDELAAVRKAKREAKRAAELERVRSFDLAMEYKNAVTWVHAHSDAGRAFLAEHCPDGARTMSGATILAYGFNYDLRQLAKAKGLTTTAVL